MRRLKILFTAGAAFLAGAWLYDGYVAFMRGLDYSTSMFCISAGLAACAGVVAALMSWPVRHRPARLLLPLSLVCLPWGLLMAYGSWQHRFLLWLQPGYLNAYDPQNPLQFFLLWGLLSTLPVGLFGLALGYWLSKR